MYRISRDLLIATALLLAASPLAARQEPPPETQAATARTPLPTRARDIQLVFEREVFHYPVENRRDPFRSLADQEHLGPLFDDLTLRMIIFSSRPGQSVALLADGAKKVYRLHKGDIIGNATVLEINQTRVLFAVEDYGNRRQETLELKADQQKEGA
jgi:type II secretory pathway component PulC